MISSGEVDFGLNARSELIQEFDTLMIAKEKMYLICNKSHPLSKKNKICLKDLTGETFIDTIRTGSVWQQLQGVLKDLNLNHSGLEVSQFSTLAGLVAQNFGTSIVPQFAVQLCKQDNVIALPIEDTKAIRPIYLIKRKGRSLSAASQAMWNQLVKNASNLL
jgi:DNA-binding transcriptional LysR family regulator